MQKHAKGHTKVDKLNQEDKTLKIEDRRSNLGEDGERIGEEEKTKESGKKGLFILGEMEAGKFRQS